MNSLKDTKNEYERLLQELKIDLDTSSKETNQIIRKAIHIFCKEHQNPAIWCLGQHTKMLMADFMNEMKNVRIIIDSSKEDIKSSGFKIITHDEIEKYHIDGVIISSYVYKEEIKGLLSKYHKGIEYLDIYEELDINGIILKSSYFSASHPYSKYQVINELQILYNHASENKDRAIYLKKIIERYLIIKDFLSAIKYTKKLLDLTRDSKYRELLYKLELLYTMEKEAFLEMSSKNVLMLCVDGLRRQDVLAGKMPKLLHWIKEEGYFFENAYSSSTSTYESLIPVYSSNNDMRTKYYEKSVLNQKECLFVNEACKQKRKIYFYTDTDQFVNCQDIIRSGYAQTITEKIWDFMCDASKEENGLFYLHVLYESHYSYANPYTEIPLIADGSNIMFDFLDTKGGKLRTDYERQQKDALQYIDDMLMPFLELYSGRIVLYADHGNILMKKVETLEELERTKYSYHKDLIEIPIVIKCPELPRRRDKRLISLMELNNMIKCLLNAEAYRYTEPQYIKVQRSKIYNPDFRYIYIKNGKEKELQAFELFIFHDNVQIVIYQNGNLEVFLKEKTKQSNIKEKYQYIISDITVCNEVNLDDMKERIK